MTGIQKSKRNKNKDLKKKEQNVGCVYTSKGEGGGFSEVLDWILRRQTSKESSLVFAILCIGRDGI